MFFHQNLWDHLFRGKKQVDLTFMFWFLLFSVDDRSPLEVSEAIQSIKYLTEVGRATNMWAACGFVWGPSCSIGDGTSARWHSETVTCNSLNIFRIMPHPFFFLFFFQKQLFGQCEDSPPCVLFQSRSKEEFHISFKQQTGKGRGTSPSHNRTNLIAMELYLVTVLKLLLLFWSSQMFFVFLSVCL